VGTGLSSFFTPYTGNYKMTLSVDGSVAGGAGRFDIFNSTNGNTLATLKPMGDGSFSTIIYFSGLAAGSNIVINGTTSANVFPIGDVTFGATIYANSSWTIEFMGFN
jgi:hypothetical protein